MLYLVIFYIGASKQGNPHFTTLKVSSVKAGGPSTIPPTAVRQGESSVGTQSLIEAQCSTNYILKIIALKKISRSPAQLNSSHHQFVFICSALKSSFKLWFWTLPK